MSGPTSREDGAGLEGISVRGCPPDSIDGAVAVTVLLSALAAAEPSIGPGELQDGPGRRSGTAVWPARTWPQVSWAGRPSPSWRPLL